MADPVERVLALYEAHLGEFEERGWSLADVYLELGGGRPRGSELHARFSEFFNGQARSALEPPDREKLDYWAGIPERGAALRDEALARLREGGVAAAGCESHRGADPRTRSLILAHNQIDAELHAHFAAASERRGRARGAVCVLGAPRSGTSLTARILNILGVDLGPEEELMEPAEANNSAGFWEHEGIADLNEDLLATLGEAPRQRWRFPPRLPGGWEHDPRLEPHRRAAQATLERSFSGRPLWGWKDPRTCLTLPFWREALTRTGGVETELRYVICVRHPLEVAASLAKRDGMPTEESLRLWSRYATAAIDQTSGLPRLFVSYEGYFSDWETQARRLAIFLGLVDLDEGQHDAIATHVDGSMRHHHVAAGSTTRLPQEYASLYAEMSELARSSAISRRC